MNEYRVTKYNPSNRNELGHYLDRSEWTEFSDVGKSVTAEQYEIVEAAYIISALDLLSDNKIDGLIIQSLEDYKKNCSYVVGEKIPFSELAEVLRSLLRGEYWCKLEIPEAFVHIGYDYYMYVGVPRADTETILRVSKRGLYVEEFESPYHPEPS